MLVYVCICILIYVRIFLFVCMKIYTDSIFGLGENSWILHICSFELTTPKCSVPPTNIPYGNTWCFTFPQPKNIDLKPPIGQLSLRGCYTILFSDQFYGLPVASERSSAGPRSLLGPLGARRQSTWSFCTIQKKRGRGGKEPQISDALPICLHTLPTQITRVSFDRLFCRTWLWKSPCFWAGFPWLSQTPW